MREIKLLWNQPWIISSNGAHWAQEEGVWEDRGRWHLAHGAVQARSTSVEVRPCNPVHFSCNKSKIWIEFWTLRCGTVYCGLIYGTLHCGLRCGILNCGLLCGTLHCGLRCGTLSCGLRCGTVQPHAFQPHFTLVLNANFLDTHETYKGPVTNWF